jgi:hypothetical protein
MALLYEKSVLWRRLVQATKDPRTMLLFMGMSTAGAAGIAWVCQAATDGATQETTKAMEKLKKKDYETARYASHSKVALGTMIDSYKKDGAAEQGGENTDGKKRIQLPGIAWHPKAVERDQREQKSRAAAKSKTTAVPSGSEKLALPAASSTRKSDSPAKGT